MPLLLVTGGTTGQTDGTLVSAGNKGTFTALNTPIDAHVRCDSGYYSADQAATVPEGVEISFDGGSSWYGEGTNPNSVGAWMGN